MPTGMLLELANCTDPARAAEDTHAAYNRWVYQVKLPAIKKARGVVSARHFCNHKSVPGQAQYLDLYEIESDDPASAAGDVRRVARSAEVVKGRPEGVQTVGQHLFRQILQSEYRPMTECNYPNPMRAAAQSSTAQAGAAQAGGAPRPAPAARPNPREPLTPPARTIGAAVYIVLSDCGDPRREEEFNRWYSYIHAPDLTPARGVVQARRWRNLEPEKGPATYAAIYEFKDDDPVAAMIDLQRLGSKTVEGRLIDCMQTRAMLWFLEVRRKKPRG